MPRKNNRPSSPSNKHALDLKRWAKLCKQTRKESNTNNLTSIKRKGDK